MANCKTDERPLKQRNLPVQQEDFNQCLHGENQKRKRLRLTGAERDNGKTYFFIIKKGSGFF